MPTGRAAPILAAALGIAVFSVMDAAMKRASLEAGVYMALLLRSLVGAAVMAPVWLLSGGRWPEPATMRVHGLRGVVSAGVAASFFWGLVRMPMAVAIAISFVAPVIALWLAAVILRERIRWPAIVAAILGVGGVVVIALARLGWAGATAGQLPHSAQGDAGPQAGLGIAAILASAVFYAWNLILQRQQAQISGPAEVAMFQSLFVSLTLAVLAPWLACVPPLSALGWIGMGGLLAAVSLMLLSWAWGRAEAQILIPIEYTAFLWAALAGWLMFGEEVTGSTLAGLALILVGCWVGTRRGSPPAHIEQTAL